MKEAIRNIQDVGLQPKPVPDKYTLEHVSKYRLEKNIEEKENRKGVKPNRINRYNETNWQQYEREEDIQSPIVNIRSCMSVELLDDGGNSHRPAQKTRIYDKMSIEDSRVSNFTFQKFLLMENICFTMTYISLFENILYSEPSLRANPMLELFMLSNVTAVTVILSTLSVNQVIFTITRYVFLVQLREDQKVIKEQPSFFKKIIRAGELKPLLIELLIICFHPNYFCKDKVVMEMQTYDLKLVKHSINDLLAIMLLLRCYIILRAIITNTKFASPRASRLCRIHLCQPNFMYSVKCILKEYPLRALLTMFIMLLFVFGHGLKLSESPNKELDGEFADIDFTDYANCFWCVIVTMGTIGYGDYYPRTLPGRLICILAAVAGVILSSLLIVALSAYLTMTPNESKAHICIKRLKLQQSLSDQASSAMISIVNLGRQIKNEETNEKTYFKEIFANLKKNTEKVKMKMRKIKSLVDNNNIYEEMVRHFSILKNNLKEIYEKQSRIKSNLQSLAELNSTRNTLNIANEVQKMVRKMHQ